MGCKSCDDLKRQAPSLEYAHGITDTVCSSVRQMKGIEDNPDSYVGQLDTKNSIDLNKYNECYIGNLATETKAYSDCDWKSWGKRVIGGITSMFKLMICWLQGMWCYIKFMADGFEVELDESKFKVTSGAGIRWIPNPVTGRYPALVMKGHSYRILGTVEITSAQDQPFGKLGLTNNGEPRRVTGDPEAGIIDLRNSGGYMIGYIDIDKQDAENPMLKQVSSFFSTTGTFTDSGCGNFFISSYDGDSGEKMPGQWGVEDSGEIPVPPHHIYVRIGLQSLVTWGPAYDQTKKTFSICATGMLNYKLEGVKC